MSDAPKPIAINRLHSIWPSQIVALGMVMSRDDPDGYLEVLEKGGNCYQTELASKVDPECPINPAELCRQLGEITGLTSIESRASLEIYCRTFHPARH
jgi:hypothetical protein